MGSSKNTSHHSRHHHSHKNTKQSNMAFELAKERKKKIWLRSIFLAILAAAIIALIVMIATPSDSTKSSPGLNPFKSDKESVEQLTNEIDELKMENMQLEYELEKYKDKYGELE